MGAKIGIFFAFLLSIAAAAGAYYLYQNLTEERAIRTTLQQQYDDEKMRAMNLQSEKEQIRAAKDQYQSESEEYQRRIRQTEGQLEQLKVTAENLTEARMSLEQELQEKDARMEEMENKIAELQKQAEDAMRACNITPEDLKATLKTPENELTFTSPTATGATAVTASATSSGTAVQAPLSTIPRILTVNRKFNFVVVNLGSKDGIKMGDQLTVYKAGVPSAVIQIEKLYDKFSAASIVKEDPRDQVKEGDEITRS